MAGFGNIAEYARSDEEGRSWVTSFRKSIGVSGTTGNQWIDWSFFSGTPLPNYYASTPLESNIVAARSGVYLPSVPDSSMFLHNVTVMGNAALFNLSVRQKLIVCDYLLYYPYIDMSTTDEQIMTQAETIPRYNAGSVIAVCQSSITSTASFIINYTNQDGVSGRVSPVNDTVSAPEAGVCVLTASGSSANDHPFLQLQENDTGVKSIESVTFTSTVSGLISLVIVKPIITTYLFESIVTSTRQGAASALTSVLMRAGAPEIKDGAVINFISYINNGVEDHFLTGHIETYWN
jgi:hypothetical protein